MAERERRSRVCLLSRTGPAFAEGIDSKLGFCWDRVSFALISCKVLSLVEPYL